MRLNCLPLLLLLCCTSLYSQENSGPEVFFSVARTASYRAMAPADAAAVGAGDKRDAATLAELLDLLPQLNVRRLNGRLGAATVSMRGFQAKQTAVYLDDVRLPPDITGTVDLSVIPAGALSRAEALPGGASALYGAGAEGGVLQLFTRRLSPGARTAEASGSLGSYGLKEASLKAGAAGGSADVYVTGESGTSDGFQRNSALARDSASARAGLSLGRAGRLSFSGLFSRQRAGLPSGTPVPVSQWDGSAERAANSLTDWQKSRRETGSLSWNGGSTELALRADASLSSNYIEALQYGSVTKARVSDRTLSVRATLGGSAVAGAESSASSLDSAVYGGHSLNSAGFFAQKTFSPAGGLELTPAARYDRSGYYAGRVSPKFSAVYSPDGCWKFSAAAGQAFQAPTYADLYNPWAAPAPGLKPEVSANISAAARYASPSGWYASLGGYYSGIKDRIALDPLTWAAANLDRGFNSGLEAGAGWRAGGLALAAAYTRARAMVRREGETYKLMNFSPRDRYSLSASLPTPAAVLEVAGRSSSVQYTGRGRSGLRLPEYWVFGLTASRSFGALEVWAGVQNLFDRHYAETADSFNGWYPQPGRTFSAGLKARLL